MYTYFIGSTKLHKSLCTTFILIIQKELHPGIHNKLTLSKLGCSLLGHNDGKLQFFSFLWSITISLQLFFSFLQKIIVKPW